MRQPVDVRREALCQVLRILSTAEDLDQARCQIDRTLGSYDKLRREGLEPQAALELAASRIERCPPPKSRPNRADAHPVRLADRLLNRRAAP
jgi:hypothetical protein